MGVRVLGDLIGGEAIPCPEHSHCWDVLLVFKAVLPAAVLRWIGSSAAASATEPGITSLSIFHLPLANAAGNGTNTERERSPARGQRSAVLGDFTSFRSMSEGEQSLKPS